MNSQIHRIAVLKLFRKNQFLRSLLLLPVALVLNINLLLQSGPSIPRYHSYVDLVLENFRTNMPIIHWIAFALLIFTGAVLINRMVIINRLSNTITLYPGLFFVVLVSAFPVFGAVTSISISLILLILLLSNLMYINVRSGAVTKIFNTGIYLGLMGLMFMPQLVYIVMILIAVNVLASMKQRIVLNLLNGMFLPYYFVGMAILFFSGSFDTISQQYKDQFGFDNFHLAKDLGGWLTLAILAMYLFIVLITYNNVISKKSIQSVRKISLVSISILFGILVHLISSVNSLHNLMLLIPAFAFFTSEGCIEIQKR